jgi:FkbM family methyltransferase
MLIESDEPVMVDGGANCGRVTDRFLADFARPTIHVFEPIPPLVEQLQQRYAGLPDVIVHPCALGAEDGPVKFNVTRNGVSSSALEVSDFAHRTHGESLDTVAVGSVEQVRIDTAIDTPIDVLKLDIQGLELQALRGCGDKLDEIRLVVTEVQFTPLYDGACLFGDIDVFLRDRGFGLFNLYDLWTHPSGRLTAGDALYVNTRLQ